MPRPRPISDAQLVDLRLQAWEEAQRKRTSRVRKIDSDDILPVPGDGNAPCDMFSAKMG
ncbi:MAG: hypothetical protein ACPG1A_16195 [Halioglobus sp.]